MKISDAVNGWTVAEGQVYIGQDGANIYNFMSVGKRITRGYKKLPALEDTDMVNLAELQIHHGLAIVDEMIWSEAMDKIPDE